MKISLFGTALCILLAACPLLQAQQRRAPVASFKENVYNFGKVLQNSAEAVHRFVFTNSSAKMLVIKDVRATCGCTATNWSKQAIAPGKKGYVNVSYNATNRLGSIDKKVRVITNNPDTVYVLRIKGEVVAQK